MAWGDVAGGVNGEAWATRCPDPTARTAYIDVFYTMPLVFRDVFVAVDGDRCYLPLPRNLEDLRVAPEYAYPTALLCRPEPALRRSDFALHYVSPHRPANRDLQWPQE